MDLIKLINELSNTSGRGTMAGRAKGLSSAGSEHTKANKSRVRIYKSITTALSKGYVGQLFSTKAADRFYVITVRKWGEDDEQMVGGKVAKGFNSLRAAKRFAMRTIHRHGKQTSPRLKSKEFWKSDRK